MIRELCFLPIHVHRTWPCTCLFREANGMRYLCAIALLALPPVQSYARPSFETNAVLL